MDVLSCSQPFILLFAEYSAFFAFRQLVFSDCTIDAPDKELTISRLDLALLSDLHSFAPLRPAGV